jgi:isopentenyl diphosphate isomerase/L-lactate dehydrogenase-like FMN-dependent dehydrogenase
MILEVLQSAEHQKHHLITQMVAADSESSLVRARTAFEKLEFSPRILRNVKDIDLTVSMLVRL